MLVSSEVSIVWEQMSHKTATQVTDVARAIIDSAKVENEFVRLTGTAGSGFIPVGGEVVKEQGKIGPQK